MEDQRIIELYHLRDEDAIAQSRTKYGRYCGRIAQNILSDPEDSEECVNDTWFSAWNTMPPQRPDCLRAYLGCLVRNCAINLYQRYHAKKRYAAMDLLLSELDECIPDTRTVEGTVEAGFLGAVLTRWLTELEPAERNLFLRRYWYGESVRALAEEQRSSANAVSSRLKRLRSRLKKRLEQEGILL